MVERIHAVRAFSIVPPMAFTLRQLQHFLAVADAGTVTEAARSLSISQSAVTEAVRDLERDLGVTLFDRHPRGLAITLSGRRFLRHATRILADVSDARSAFVSEAASTEGATLSLGVTSLVAGYVLSDLLARHRRAFPDVRVRAIEDSADHLEHLLINGELDIGVMVIPAEHDPMALDTSVIAESRCRLWLPLGHPLCTLETVPAEALADQPLIELAVDEIGERTRTALARLPARPHVALRTRSVEAVRSLVATGAGIALLPDLVYRPWSLEGDRIEARSLAEDLPLVEVGVVRRRGSVPTPAVERFIELARTPRASLPRL